jgi:hypothetical protein
MIISPTNKFVFFKPMKTAGSSVEFALALSCGPDDLVVGGMTGDEHEAGFLQQNNEYYDEIEKEVKLKFHSHTTPNSLKKRISDEQFSDIEDLTWVTMSRNPWDTIVSFYWWSHRKYNESNEEFRILEGDSNKTAKDKFSDFIFFNDGIQPGITPNSQDIFRPWKYIQKYNTQFLDPRMDHYIRFENIEQDFEHVVDTLGLYNVELPRFKTTQKKLKKHYSYYYTNETKQIVADGFKDYIEKFDYKFEWKDKKLSRRERSKMRRNK